MRVENLLGQTFNQLTAIGFVETRNYMARWLWRCTCGTFHVAYAGNVKSGKIKSCGCLVSRPRLTHGAHCRGATTPEYATWSRMKTRCYNSKDINYHHYGGRGIAVCDRWLHSFENFLADMGLRPSPEHSIERRDNNAGYSPDNCYWATDAEQRRNKRTNRVVTFNGETLCATDWATRAGLDPTRFLRRLYAGWSVERALTEPLRVRVKH